MMIELLISPAVEFLKRLDTWWKDKTEKNLAALREVFELQVTDVFRRLELVHKDYSVNLAHLRQKLENRAVPPKELIDWIEMQGLAYRHERDALYAYADQVAATSALPIDPTSGKAEALAFHAREFLRSVEEYLSAATDYNQLSFYRDFAQQLTSVWRVHQATGRAPDTFFEAGEVVDMCDALRHVTDVALPRAWRKAAAAFQAARQAEAALATKH